MTQSTRDNTGKTRGGFTLTEILVAVAAVSVLTVAVAQIFQTVGNTVDRGRAVSRFNQTATRLEAQMRADLERMSADGFIVIRHALIGSNGQELMPRDVRPTLQSILSNPNGQGQVYVERAPEDPDPRPRRADELLFFAEGEFTSARPPLVPGLAPTASAARIYYGHGVREPAELLENASTDDVLPLPQVNDDWLVVSSGRYRTAAYRLGGNTSEPPGSRGPNEYASDWTLLRHVTLMAGPNPTDFIPAIANRAFNEVDVSENVINLAPPGESIAKDRTFQLGGQPAASSVFGSIGQLLLWDHGVSNSAYVDADPTLYLRGFGPGIPRGVADAGYFAMQGDAANPTFASGLVDIATESISDLRRVINGSASLRVPGGVNGSSEIGFNGPAEVIGGRRGESTFGTDLAAFPLLLEIGDAPVPANTPSFRDDLVENLPVDSSGLAYERRQEVLANMQAWMRDAFPTNDLGRALAAFDSAGTSTAVPTNRELWGSRRRVRYEPDAPDLFLVLDQDEFVVNDYRDGSPELEDDLVEAQRLADQEMLASQIFTAGCTEFIVEWSFGLMPDDQRDSDFGELIWHGLARTGDDNDEEYTGTLPESFNAQNDYLVREYPFRRIEGADEAVVPSGRLRYREDDVPIDPVLIHGYPYYDGMQSGPSSGAGLFGDNSSIPVAPGTFDWNEPLRQANSYTFRSGSNTEEDDRVELYSYFGYINPLEGLDREWPRPKLIRVTISLADPTDPLVEETFQFVFEVPQS
ncbi:MAG: prepilin-type N-terminal cleavage/methylation domain-containing protein [Planctomycetota bacterium]